MKKLVLGLVVLLMMVAGAAVAQEDSLTPEAICEAAQPISEPETREFDAPEDVLEAGVDYRAVFCTAAGPIYVDLFETLTPVTVNNFVFLAQNNYYNNTTFHRVLQDFMAQGGDPTGTGTGGPGYRFRDEFVGYVLFDRPGLLAMANAGAGTNGSQFFITTSLTPHLNFAHTIFGEVLTGYDNVTAIDLRDPQTASEPGTLLETVVIITDPAEVDAEYELAETATRDDFEAVLAEVPEIQGVDVNTDLTGIRETSEVVEAAEEGAQEDLEALLTSNNHQYTVSLGHINTACDLASAPLQSIRYQIHVFETAADARVAAQSEQAELLVTSGFDYEAVEGEFFNTPLYQQNTSVCDQTGTRTRAYRQVGRFILVTEAVLPEDSQFTPEIFIDQLINPRLYEAIFAEALRPEVTQ
ncbi:MAG: hypothetical protein OHK0046_34560 [Anaerolineae bacterium]